MKVVILAGGLGTRLSEETDKKPKPMIEIGGRPILWHIMKLYSYYGFNEFIICAGYKSYCIKDYFYHYFMHSADMTINMQDNKIIYHHSHAEPWQVTVVDTGLTTMTGGRIKRVKKYVGNERFMATYGDGLSNQNLKELLAFHESHGKLGTMTTVQPSGRFGSVDIGNNNQIKAFMEKPRGDGAIINAGFFVFEPDIFNYIEDDNSILERAPLEGLVSDKQLFAYKHDGFWKPMDTLRERLELEEMWESGKAPWKVWND